MNYRYIAIEHDNRLVEGALEAGSDQAVEDWLAQAGLRVVTVQPAGRSGWWRRFVPKTPTITKKDLVLFSQQLATLVNAGTSLLTALQLLADQTRSTAFREVLYGLMRDLKTGLSLHEAMAKSPKVFPLLFTHMIAASERSGTLEPALRHLAMYLQKDIALAHQVKKALTYPAFVTIVAVVVVGVLVTVVLPTFAEMLASFNTPLPLITRMVLGFSHLVQAWKVPALVSMAATVCGGALFLHSPTGRQRVDRMLLQAPVIGRLVIQTGLVRLSRTMGLLLNAGLPVPECLALARYASGNQAFQKAIMQIRTMLLEGQSLAQAFGSVGFIPRLYVQLVRIGEETGTLEANLNSLADAYEREVEDQLSTLTTLVEPVLTLAMGIVVAVIALSVVLPIFSLMDSIQAS